MPKPKRSKTVSRYEMSRGDAIKQQQIHEALLPVDAAISAAERRWGVGGLQQRVPADMAARWGSAWAKLCDAIEANEPDEVAKKAAVVLRGIAALEKAAKEAGAEPPSVEGWHAVSTDGEYQILIVEDMAAASLAQRRTDVAVFSLEEVANVVQAWRGQMEQPKFVEAAKKAFPGATWQPSEDKGGKRKVVEELNDELPF